MSNSSSPRAIPAPERLKVETFYSTGMRRAELVALQVYDLEAERHVVTIRQGKGNSALGLQRILGLGSYQTAWTWLHKLRRAMVRPAGNASKAASRWMRPTWAVRKRVFTAEKLKTRRLWPSRRRKTAEELGGFDCEELPMCPRTVCTWPGQNLPSTGFVLLRYQGGVPVLL